MDRRSDNPTSVDVEIDPHWTLVFGGCSFPPVSYIYMFILSLGPAGDCPGLRGSWSAVTVGVRIPWYLRRAVGVRIPWYLDFGLWSFRFPLVLVRTGRRLPVQALGERRVLVAVTGYPRGGAPGPG